MILPSSRHVIEADTADELWLELLRRLTTEGVPTTPRGMATLELQPMLLMLNDPRQPVITVADRGLNYGFMVAEALWILAGRNDLAFLERYNHNMRRFSDDGLTMFGAYGPWIAKQLHYVIAKLGNDPDSRQAVLTIWQQVPPLTKDVPCTISMQFLVRSGELVCHVTMRSSDAWLGLPYDLYTFTRVQAVVAGQLGLPPGRFTLLAGSSHIYTEHIGPAIQLGADYHGYTGLSERLAPFNEDPSPSRIEQLEAASRSDYHALTFTSAPELSDMYEVLWWYNHHRAWGIKPSTPLARMVQQVAIEQAFNAEARKLGDDAPKP